MKIAVVGAGYVGLSNAILHAYRHDVVLLELDGARVAAINAGESGGLSSSFATSSRLRRRFRPWYVASAAIGP